MIYGDSMRRVPWWALLSSGLAPVVLIAGWVVAGLMAGSSYDPATKTISVLAADGAPGAWVMTGALVVLGLCHMATAWGLRPAALPGRLTLGGGGAAAVVVALFPAPSSGGSLQHGSLAAVGFVLLAVWPVLAYDPNGTAAWALRRGPCLAATAVMGVGALWFLFELQRHGALGVAERLVTFLQSVCPLLVVVSCLRHQRLRSPVGPRSRV
ncbi:DUF998 domain-containing protein [Streptomyces thermospinosisporus]|uniref:DUF998 domain-containing protein n=2 Tax=Streptomyces thermospinosisporus TaxID=161482 RepID=A0ABP4JZ89_9ACTN